MDIDEVFLSTIPLFASLTDSQIRHLQSALQLVELASGAFLFREGDPADGLYIVLAGELHVIKSLGTPEERLLVTRCAGDSFGEMCLFNPDGLRTATVRAVAPTRLLTISSADFRMFIDRIPLLGFEIARQLSLNLRSANEAIIRDLQMKNRQLALAYEELQTAQAQIIEKEKLDHELQVARTIQLSILPRCVPHLPGFDFGIYMIPAHAVGGDFFDFIPLGGGSVGIAIGDVSGKGIPAAIFMSMTRSLMRAEAMRAQSPSEALLGVNRTLLDMNDAGMFVTVLYGVLDGASGTFVYSRAGHDLPFLCDGHGVVEVPSCGHGQPLGVFEAPDLDEQQLRAAPGSTLLLYTDGLTDSRSPEGLFWGRAGIASVMQHCCGGSAQQICQRIVEAVFTHQGSAMLRDDLTLIAVHALQC